MSDTKIEPVDGFDGIVRLETSKRVDELRRDDDVILIDDSGDSVTVLVDVSDYLEKEMRYIH